MSAMKAAVKARIDTLITISLFTSRKTSATPARQMVKIISVPLLSRFEAVALAGHVDLLAQRQRGVEGVGLLALVYRPTLAPLRCQFQDHQLAGELVVGIAKIGKCLLSLHHAPLPVSPSRCFQTSHPAHSEQ